MLISTYHFFRIPIEEMKILRVSIFLLFASASSSSSTYEDDQISHSSDSTADQDITEYISPELADLNEVNSDDSSFYEDEQISHTERDITTDNITTKLSEVKATNSDNSFQLERFYRYIGKNEKGLKMAASLAVLAAATIAVMNTDPASVRQLTDGFSSFLEQNLRGLQSIPRELARMFEGRIPSNGRELIALLGAARLMVHGFGKLRRKSRNRTRSFRR